MTKIGNHTMTKTAAGYVVTAPTGEVTGTYPSAQAAMIATVRIIADAHKAKGAK